MTNHPNDPSIFRLVQQRCRRGRLSFSLKHLFSDCGRDSAGSTKSCRLSVLMLAMVEGPGRTFTPRVRGGMLSDALLGTPQRSNQARCATWTDLLQEV